MADQWVECKTPGASGRVYYINKESGKISWTMPPDGTVVRAKGAAPVAKKSPRWSALSSTILKDGGGGGSSTAKPKKASALIRDLLAKTRRGSASETEAPAQKAPASPFTKNKNAYRDALARARRMVQEATSLSVDNSPGPTAPSAMGPNATAPNATAPNATAPNATAPNATAPTATASSATTDMGNGEGTTSRGGGEEATKPSGGASDDRRLSRAKRIITEWKRKTCGRWFGQWYRNAAKLTACMKESQMNEKLKRSENALKLSEARSELALARCEVDSWRRAKSEKDALVRKMAFARLKKWEKSMNNRTKLSFDKWARFVDMERVEDIKTLKKIVKKQTRETALYKTAMKDAKKKHKAAAKELAKVRSAAPGLFVGKDPETPRGRAGSVASSDGSGIDLDSPGGGERGSGGLGGAAETTNAFNLEADNKRLSRQVDSLTSECNRLIQSMKELEARTKEQLQGANVVSTEDMDNANALVEHWKQLAGERDEQNKALAEEHMEERNKWMRRFQMQQETIEGLENDVEELSELKVLELAENYYVSTQNGYN